MNNNLNTGSKIKDLEELAGLLGQEKSKGKKVILCHGVFDLLHIGHIRHFEEAKKRGDILAVTTTPDHLVNKGPGRPVFNEGLRAEAIASLDCVDYVAINRWPMAVETIRLLRPDFYVKGSDYSDAGDDRTGGITLEEEAVKSVGGQIAFTDEITFSSSNLINRHLPVFDKEISDYLAALSSRHSSDEVNGYLERASSLKVLVVGETIVDEYQYCEMIGKATKDPIQATLYHSTEKFAGGVIAVANHLANFCEEVGLLTMLGDRNSEEDFIRESLKSNVDPTFFFKDNSPTIVKRRWVESHLLQKLFEVYEMNDEELTEEQDQELCSHLEEILSRYDLVIALDYGHGMIGSKVVDLLCQKSRFLAVNTQANAGNRGFNTISKYPRADYVCLARHEISLEERNRRDGIQQMILNVSRKLDCGRVMVTRSKDGNIFYDQREGFSEAPAFESQPVDRMGAGDAVLALTSLCVAQDAPPDVVTFIGNVVGAEAVATLAHSRSIERLPLFRHIETLLK
jgi:rfaE bifunctional protein nucleotidyltransferase chain/domain